MHVSSCHLPKDVGGRPSAIRELAFVGRRGEEVCPIQHQALMWSQDSKPYGMLACRDVQSIWDRVGDKERSAKELSLTVQLNILASCVASCVS